MFPPAKTGSRKRGKAQRDARHPSLVLHAQTAQELMTLNPISLEAGATVQQATALLFDKGFSAVPVIDEAGRPIGVLSRADILWFAREACAQVSSGHEYYQTPELGLPAEGCVRSGFLLEKGGDTPAREIMTPTVYAVLPETPVPQVVEEMLGRRVHRLFVVDRAGTLIGVISALDVIRALEEVSVST